MILTGSNNVAIDMVANCVNFHRNMLRPIRTIYLRPVYFQEFVEAVWKRMEDEGIDIPSDMTFEWDKVTIMRGSEFQSEAISCDFYPLMKIISDEEKEKRMTSDFDLIN